VKEMGWDEMQALFASLYVDEIASLQRDGGEATVREKLAVLSEDSRRVLREALLEPELA
jgi:Mg/Co/Ni transporter MgtE